MAKRIDITCTECEVVFDKALSEYTRQLANGRVNFFCGLSCTNSFHNKHSKRPPRPLTQEYLTLRCGICKSKFTRPKSSVDRETKQWAAKGHTAKKQFFCSRGCGQAFSGEHFSDAMRTIKVIAKSLRVRGDLSTGWSKIC